MALKLDDKKAIVKEVHEVAIHSLSVVAANYRGLSVAQMTDLRVRARTMNVYLKVVPNTLARRALEGTEFSCLQEVLEGPLFLAFSKKDPGAAARLIQGFLKQKENEMLDVKALSMSGRLLAAKELAAIASLPTRDEAIVMLMFVMKAPITKFVRTLAASYAKLVHTVAAIGEKKKAA